MSYVDGFVIPVPKKNLKTYARMTKAGEKMWMKNGALDYKECGCGSHSRMRRVRRASTHRKVSM